LCCVKPRNRILKTYRSDVEDPNDMRKFNCPCAIGSVTALACFLILFIPLSESATTIPKFGFSIQSDADVAQFIKVAVDCKMNDAFLMLPPALLSISPEGKNGDSPQVRESTVDSIPAGLHLYARISTEFGSFAQKGRELENLVSGQIEEIMARQPLSNTRIEGLFVEIGGSFDSEELMQYALASIAVKAKARKSSLRVVLSLPPDFIDKHGALVKRLANYYDALSPEYTPGWSETLSWISKQALNKRVFMRLEPDRRESPQSIASTYVDTAIALAKSSIEVLYFKSSNIETLTRVCSVAAFLSHHLPDRFVQPTAAPSAFAVTAEGTKPGDTKIFNDTQSQETAILVKTDFPGHPRNISLHMPSGSPFEAEWYDVMTDTKLKPDPSIADSTGTVQSCRPGSAYSFILVRDLTPSKGSIRSSIEVTAEADLTVEEVIARWQRYREAQNQLLLNFVADCFTSLHFESTLISASGFDVSMQFQQFWNRDGLIEWAQSDFYVNGVKFGKGKEFPLPQLEPEKVVSQPLELKLNEKYSYRLNGMERVNDVLCYVVAVEPKEQTTALYSGRIWIDGTTFRHIKMELSQRSATGSIVANTETQHFSLISDDQGNKYNLTQSIHAQQTLNAAGRNFIVQKIYTFSNYRINEPHFESELTAAHLSDEPMYRETETGLSTLKKEGNHRVLVATGKRVRSIIGGLLYEGSFSFPIPLAGLSQVDFNWRKTGAQLSVFFAGPILAANLSKQWKNGFRLGWDVALSAIPGTDRVYSGSTELTNKGFYHFEEATGGRATWQATTNLSFTGASHISYNLYRANGDTDKNFILPRNGFTWTPSFELKYARTGYLFTAGTSLTRRIRWETFGLEDDALKPVRNQFDKYYANFSKDFYFGKFTKTGLSLSYYGGDKLDRISRYRTSFLSEPRIKGIPSSTDSFDTVAVASINHGINIFDFIKLEGSYNHAWTRNREESTSFRGFDGLQVDFGTAGPWATYMQGSITYALKGNLDRYDSRWGVYLLIYKPLR
jgi:hypothetical protein